MPRVLEQGKQFQLSYKTSRWNAFLMFSSSWDRNSRIRFPRLRRASSQRTEDCIKFSGNYSHGKGCFDRSNLFAESLWIDRSSLFSLFIFNLRMLFAIPLLRDIFIMKILNGFIFLWIAKDDLWKYNAVYRFFIVKDLLKIVFIVFSCPSFISKLYRLQCHLFYLFISSTDYRIFLLSFLRIIRNF